MLYKLSKNLKTWYNLQQKQQLFISNKPHILCTSKNVPNCSQSQKGNEIISVHVYNFTKRILIKQYTTNATSACSMARV